MVIKQPINKNYCATVVEINTIVKLDNCDNVSGTILFGNHVIVDNSTKLGDIGLFFPVETQLTKEFLQMNNLYRKPELNFDSSKKGYFEENGRVRCVKFRGNNSEGFYIPKNNNQPSQSSSKKSRGRKSKETKIIDNQFKFHDDTSHLGKNIHRINPDSVIQVSYKLHGTSGISSYVLCKKKLSFFEKILKKIGINIIDTQYDYIYSSRKVIKNPELNPNANHYYNIDIWGIANNQLKYFLQRGMTFYYEIVGYLPNGKMIQKGYDYGYTNPLELWGRDFIISNDGEEEYNKLYASGRDGKKSFGIYIYRITYTNFDGKIFEFSAKQIQDFCKKNGLNAVPELYYGYAVDMFTTIYHLAEEPHNFSDQNWNDEFFKELKNLYNEKDCYMCSNKVPEEGCVVRIEGSEFEAYKCKSTRFLEFETKQLDSGESNIEDEN